MSLTKVMSGLSTYNEDLRCIYYAPLKPYDFQEKIRKSGFMADLTTLKKEMEKLINSEIERVNPIEKNTNYFNEEGQYFFAKDGQTDVYVKRGLDEEMFSYFERQEASKKSMRLQTSNPFINFFVGGKIVLGSKEWYIAAIINVYSGAEIENKIKGTYNMDAINNMTQKILVLI